MADFLYGNPETGLGQLFIHDEFATSDLQRNSWRKEIVGIQQTRKRYTRRGLWTQKIRSILISELI